MADRIFENQKLAGIYDLLDSPDRPDLDLYINIAEELILVVEPAALRVS